MEALKIARLNEGDDFVLGDLCSQMDGHSETVKVLEAKRAEAGKDYWEKKKVATAKFEAAKKAASEQLGDLKELIEHWLLNGQCSRYTLDSQSNHHQQIVVLAH